MIQKLDELQAAYRDIDEPSREFTTQSMAKLHKLTVDELRVIRAANIRWLSGWAKDVARQKGAL